MDAPKFRTEAKVHEPKTLVFGKHGTGKTMFALSTGKPTVRYSTSTTDSRKSSDKTKQRRLRSQIAQSLLAQVMKKRRRPRRPTPRPGNGFSIPSGGFTRVGTIGRSSLLTRSTLLRTLPATTFVTIKERLRFRI